MGDPARTSHIIRMQHPEDSSAVRLAVARGEKETSEEIRRERHDHHRSSVQGTGRRSIYPYIKPAPASRREAHALEQVPPLAWQHCETCSMFDEAAEKQQHPQPPVATIVRQMTSSITVFLQCRGTENPTSHDPMQDGPESSPEDPIDTPAARQHNATAGSSTSHPTLLAMI